MSSLLAIAGFQYTGLFPLNKKRINQHALAISETFNQPPPLMALPTVYHYLLNQLQQLQGLRNIKHYTRE